MTEVDDKELARRLRQNILNVLELWSSKERQLEYQQKVPIAQVSVELFCQWSDDFYYPETSLFKMAFDELEREILSDFDKGLNHIADKISTNLPYITDFVKTNDWLHVNLAAKETLTRIENTAGDSSYS